MGGRQSGQDPRNGGDNCNVTPRFSLEQAIIYGQASVTLISPFVARILDLYGRSGPVDFVRYDPGVNSMKIIHRCSHKRLR
jgi:transaldolase